jgi:hypothetical protein
MDALGLFRLRYDAIHGSSVDDLFAGLTDAQVRQRPHGLNSVAWLVWHATRVEDAAVSRFVADRPQVLEDGDWRRHVEALSARIDVPALRGYARAVAERTRAIADTLPSTAWDEIVPPERIRRVVVDEGLLTDAGRWVEEFWARGHSRGWYLLQTALLHPWALRGAAPKGPQGKRRSPEAASSTWMALTGQFSAALRIRAAESPAGFATSDCRSALWTNTPGAMVRQVPFPTHAPWSTQTRSRRSMSCFPAL